MTLLFSRFLCGLSPLFFYLWCVIPLQAQVVMDEHFTSNERYWFEGNAGDVNAVIKNGSYLVHRLPDAGERVFTVDHFIDPSKDFTFELTFQITEAIPGAFAGLVWNYADMNNFDAFVISNDGSYKVLALRYGTMFLVSDENSKSKTIQDKGENSLQVHRQKDHLSFGINGKQVFESEFPGISFSAHGVYLMKKISCSFTSFRLLQEQTINKIESFHPEKITIGTAVNSMLNDSAPVISPDGSRLFFVREKQGAHDADIFSAVRKSNGQWEEAKSIGTPLNNKVFNSVISCGPDNRSLLLLNTYAQDGSYKGCCFSMSRFQDGHWTVPVDVQIENLQTYGRWLDASLSADGRTMLLSVLRPGTLGYNDLYVSFLSERGIWSEPQSLGATINTIYNDAGPFLAPDNKTLYFSSLGYPGYGNQDIFMSRRLDDSWSNWSKPVNLGPSINSKGFDAFFSIAANDSSAYLVSNAGTSKGMDIYTTTFPKELLPGTVCLLRGRVMDGKTGSPLEAQLVYKALKHPQTNGMIRSEKKDGRFQMILPVAEEYYVSAEKEGYYAQADSFVFNGGNQSLTKELIIKLDPLVPGAALPIRQLYFERSKAEFLPTSLPALENLYSLMFHNPSLHIRIEGHTDNIGDVQLNQQLSEERAQAVMNYLLKRGIDPNRIQSLGYGSSRPVADNSTEETRKQNRRVEFTVLER